MTPEELLGLERIPPALTAQQAALLLGVSKQTVYRAHQAGELQGVRLQGRLVIAAKPLLEALGWEAPPPASHDENAPP